ncbi:MAG: hypothetical protein HZB67_05825 [Candidatus Aenigmarchaeota archaeon]|nr:hypothetical protein [Candidatus Aenigmarchaeota archaeon]
MNKKGITPVISIVLLLMITIALIGFAFVWFTKIWNIAAESGTQGVIGITESGQKSIQIENWDSTNGLLTIKNMGTADISAGEIRLYIAGASSTACDDTAPLKGRVDDCTGITCNPGDELKAVGPSNYDTISC